ncbi:hypothetical protein PR003_g4937 [Phytophthora rubi]|uniref:No apical meristem-associated C-terminal domain-containing protein n=1 Tax=Phytophthora rubi TaxID=129364 RepID=A0A6A3NRK3_9STRA|nr:hypothetical protein PR001_g4755 [Phytophthora rubi]KAE9351334.1 hypothetical protein PR003_g4937 [Phytophthora rubi]
MLRAKGKNFTEEEESQLCRSYLHVSIDAKKGTSQTSSKFWENLAAHFNAAREAGSDLRSQRSLECKWSIVQHDVAKFCGAMAVVQDLNKSGANAEDEVKDAQQYYKETHMTKGVKDNKAFKFLHCWRILSAEPKWKSFRASIGAGISAKTDTSDDSRTAGNPRPPGNKATKAATQLAEDSHQVNKRLASATDRIARASEKRVRAMEEANNLMLFTVPLSSLEPDALEYVRLRRAAVLKLARAADASAFGTAEASEAESSDNMGGENK